MKSFAEGREARRSAKEILAAEREEFSRLALLRSTSTSVAGSTIESALPAAARSALRLPALHPKIWEKDLRPVTRKHDPAPLLARAHAVAKERVKGGDDADPSIRTIMGVARTIVRTARTDGFCRRSFVELGRMSDCGRESARKVVRFLERKGWLNTFNVITRTANFVRRACNLYLVAEDGATGAASIAERVRRYAGLFRLAPRPWGLNKTPSRMHPAPS